MSICIEHLYFWPILCDYVQLFWLHDTRQPNFCDMTWHCTENIIYLESSIYRWSCYCTPYFLIMIPNQNTIFYWVTRNIDLKTSPNKLKQNHILRGEEILIAVSEYHHWKEKFHLHVVGETLFLSWKVFARWRNRNDDI